ncbi:MAG: hypothetical protein HYZ65_02430 [Burkholderiales bacterium]|nr:hypothetical protein [Burkholderiales bacterium]
MKMTSLFRSACALTIVVTLAALTGCASQLTQRDMTPAPMQLAKHHPQSVSLTALPPPSADAAATAATMTELRAALAAAISESKAFANVKPEGGEYQLTVQIFNEQHPSFGISFTSKIEMGWTLKRADTGTVVWQEAIKSEHTTGGSEAFAGAERVKMAIAGAIRKNISLGLSRIDTLSL